MPLVIKTKASSFFIIMIFCILITIISVIIAIICATKRIKVDIAIKENNDNLKKELDILESKKEVLLTNINDSTNQLDKIQTIINNSEKNQEKISQDAFNNYLKILENEYDKKEKEYNLLCQNLDNAYEKQQILILEEINKNKAELDKIKSTRAAAIDAQRKEKEIKEKLSFYCLNLSKTDIQDIQKLEDLKPSLHNQRILSMLIWSTFFQKQMTALCNNVLGTNTIIGIYKITNQKNNMCYIGQSTDIANRWKQHAKCGLGIDTPPANKLYKAMIEEGIWNFSWELLEQCSREELDEKEKFYINLYQSYEFGYNSNTGNNRR